MKTTKICSIPELEPHCGSWIVVSRETGKPVFETFYRRTAEAVNQDRYEVLTALQWLVRFNRQVREAAPAILAERETLRVAMQRRSDMLAAEMDIKERRHGRVR